MSYEVRANVAGPSYVDSLGKTWLADKAYSPGSWGYVAGITYTDKFTFPIVDTPDPTLYKTSRYWEGTSQRYQLVGSYRFDVPVPGLYQVYLHFAETAKFSQGARVFRLNLEGVTVLDNFDIFLQAPYPYHHAALVQALPVQVNDGTLNIDFYNIIDSPTINAIRVVSLMPATRHADTLAQRHQYADSYRHANRDQHASRPNINTLSFTHTDAGARLPRRL